MHRRMNMGKGFYQRRILVPLDLFSPGPTRSRAAIGWTPLTRDGGQQLGRKSFRMI